MPFLHIAFKLSLSCSKQGKNVTNEHLFVKKVCSSLWVPSVLDDMQSSSLYTMQE